jgi:hypothetical protein
MGAEPTLRSYMRDGRARRSGASLRSAPGVEERNGSSRGDRKDRGGRSLWEGESELGETCVWNQGPK